MMNVIEGHARAARRRSAIFACVLALCAALGAMHAAGASALGEQCSGSNAKGLGAFLQTQAQERWSAESEAGFNGSPNPLACSGSQGSGGTPDVSYVPLGSPAALRAWGAEDGVYHAGEFGFPVNFLGTDIAPSGPVGEEGTMLANMKKALGSDLAVVPVTQTAIAIAAHPPALPAHPPCLVPQITPVQLQKVFSGEIKNWRQIGTSSDSSVGGDCDQAITRIVRGEGAGTTYQFKHFLNSVNSAPLACTGKTKRTWAQLQAPFGGEATPNLEWPRSSDCQPGEGNVTTVAPGPGEGESSPLSYVAKNAGTITYGSLPEARLWAPEQIVKVFNGIKYAQPSITGGEANCGAAKYTRPAGWESGVNVDWSGVYGSDPNIGESSKNAYPICTLTWDVAATDRFTEKVATTVHDYLAFAVAKEGGQVASAKVGYRSLPASIVEAANAAIAQINGKEEEGEEEEGEVGTVLCKAEPSLIEGVLTCPKEQGFNEGKVTGTVLPEQFAVFKSGEPEFAIFCPQGNYVGEFNEDGTSAGGLYQLAFGQVEGCVTSLPEGPEAVVSLENPPFDASSFEYLGPEGPNGRFVLAKSGSAPPLLRIQSSIVCVYMPSTVEFRIYNGSPSQMIMEGKWKLAEGSPEGGCPTVLDSYAPLSMTRLGEGKPLYIAGK